MKKNCSPIFIDDWIESAEKMVMEYAHLACVYVDDNGDDDDDDDDDLRRL